MVPLEDQTRFHERGAAPSRLAGAVHCLLEAVLRSGALTKRCLRCIFVVEASKRAWAAGAAGLKTGHPHHTWLRVFGQAILTAVKINTRYMHAKLPTGMGSDPQYLKRHSASTAMRIGE